MSRFIPGDYVRPACLSLGLPLNSVWTIRTAAINGERIRIEPVDRLTASAVRASVYCGLYFPSGKFEKVVRYMGEWVPVDRLPTCKPGPAYDQMFFDSIAKEVLHAPTRATSTTMATNGTASVSFTEAVDPAQAAKDIADSLVVAAEKRLTDAKEQARKQRALLAEQAKSKAQAEKLAAAAKAEREQRDAFRKRLDEDAALAMATSSLILEVRRLFNGGSEQLASSDITKHASQLDALAKSYGFKIVRTGAKSVVAKL